MRTRIALLIALTLALAVPAVADAKKHAKIDTFQGTCQLHGTLSFSPAMTGFPQPLGMSVRAKGTCSGTLTYGRHTKNLSSARASAREAGTGTTSCEASYQAGRGRLKLAGRRIDGDFVEPRGPVGTARWTGTHGGSATIFARFSQSEDLAQLFASCSGAGVKSLKFDADLVTTPSFSG